MLFKKKDKESKPKKEKKVPVMKVGTHKKTVIALWLVLIAFIWTPYVPIMQKYNICT